MFHEFAANSQEFIDLKQELEHFCKCLLPGDNSLGVPACSLEIFFAYPLEITSVSLDCFLDFLQNGCDKNVKFIHLKPEEVVEGWNRFKSIDPNTYSLISNHLLRNYYLDSKVLISHGIQPGPSFPSGNLLPATDFSILEAVYSRGEIYRR